VDGRLRGHRGRLGRTREEARGNVRDALRELLLYDSCGAPLPLSSGKTSNGLHATHHVALGGR
jgi:hypothetical protein